jgi:hypothetical protein
MDLKEYYSEIRGVETGLEKKHGMTLFITSIKNRDRGSTPGSTFIAKPYNAARAIVDETHREATEQEIKEFLEHQERNRIQSARSEALKRKEVVVVMDRGGNDLPSQSNDLVEAAMQASSAGPRAPAPVKK